MPLWPFGRKKLRSGTSRPSTPEPEKVTQDRNHFATHPQNATPRVAARTKDPEETPRKRRRSSGPLYDEKEAVQDTADQEKTRPPRSRVSRENITALPGSRKLDTSPHLRSPVSAAIPYNSSPTPPSRKAAMEGSVSPNPRAARGNPSSRTPSTSQQRRLSKRQEHVDRAIREEEIRAMSAPVPVPKRQDGHGDMLRRDSKKAKRTFSKHAGDSRGSNVSLPFQESIHSSMSGTSDQRGWEVAAFLNPRPTVRLSIHGAQNTTGSGLSGVSRNGSKKDKLSTLKEDVKKKDRRRIAELADDMDASDIRALMERDSRRKDKKKIAEQIKLERSLRKKADKQRAEDERRARDIGTPAPTDIHPAFRSRAEEKQPVTDSTIGQAPPTPMSVKQNEDALSPSVQQDTYLKYGPDQDPFRDPEPDTGSESRTAAVDSSPFADPETQQAVSGARPYSPMETPAEDPVLETAQAIRFSQGRLSQSSPSPPRSPIQPTYSGQMSPLRREYTPEPTAAPSPVEEPTVKRPSTWAQLFRRGAPNRVPEDLVVSPSESSFSNTSRESRSRQPLPAHLVGTAGTVSKRRSETPARTQSIFREDLPEIAHSRPTSRVASPEVPIPSGSAFAVRKAGPGALADTKSAGLGRTDSPVEKDGKSAAFPMPTSLASVDSEAEWLTGRPSLRKGNTSQVQSNIGSLAKRHEGFNASYEDLGMSDEEYFRHLTPNPDKGEEFTAGTSLPSVEDEGGMIRRDTTRRRPTLVERDPRVRSREGLLLDFQGGEAATFEEASSSGENTPENDKFDDQPGPRIEYGQGHARKISSGSAKLLDIPPSRTRSGRTTPESRLSTVGTPLNSPKL